MPKNLLNQRRIASPLALLPNGSLGRNVILTFSTDGILENVQTEVQTIDSLASVEYYNGVLIPSMTNAHCHLELSYFKGKIPQATGLVSFIKHVIAHRQDEPIQTRVERLKVQDKVMWGAGVGAVGDISNNDFSLDCKAQSDIYYHTFAEYFGMPKEEDTEAYFRASTDAVVNRAAELGVVASPSAHSTYLVGDKIFKMGGASERESIHFMETASEVDFFEKKGEMYDFVSSDMEVDFLHYGSHVNRLIESLPRELPLVLVHCVNMQDADIRRVMDYFEDVTFVLCPRSNYYIERSFPPVMMFRDLGARIALGTDSLCSNTSLDMIAEVEWLLKNNSALSAAEVLMWATAAGADALAVGDRLGRFEVGTRCGAVLVEGFDVRTMELAGTLVSKRLI